MKSTINCPTHNNSMFTSKGLMHFFRLFILLFISSVYAPMSLAEAKQVDIEIKRQSMAATTDKRTLHFGRLVGQWEIKDQSLSKAGKWQAGPGANWNFYWILGGSAIQDDWISPGYNTPAPKQGRQFGTNIRIFNPNTSKWEMAWTSNTGKKVDTFEAVSTEESMVMQGIYNNQPTRITFYNITNQRFSWKMEKQNSDTKAWQAVYKIEAYKLKD